MAGLTHIIKAVNCGLTEKVAWVIPGLNFLAKKSGGSPI